MSNNQELYDFFQKKKIIKMLFKKTKKILAKEETLKETY
jgi:hypothetical protein